MTDIIHSELLKDKEVLVEINRYKWLESEIAGYDIGFEAAAEDWLRKHAVAWVKYHTKGSPKISAASPRKSAPKRKKRS